jgi:hypothetical protein
MNEYKLMMLTNAKPGREDELKDWYERHLDDMLKLPGVVGAQCFDADTDISSASPSPYKYLAVYDISTDDLSSTLAALQGAVGTSAMPMSDALDPASSAVIYRARGPRRHKAS